MNVKPASDVAGSDYGTFSIQVRVHNPGGTDDDNILEQYDNLTLDPTSANFFAKRIGDRWVEIDSNGKLTYNGDWPNQSVHIYMSDWESNLEGIDEAILPHGYAAPTNPVLGTTSVPAAVKVTAQNNANGVFEKFR